MIGAYDTMLGTGDMTTSTRPNLNEEGERLRLCRERNKLHAQTTRDRKKSQNYSLENRIGNLVEEKNRLKSSVAESSIASILMSLSSTDNPISKLPSKIEDVYEDVQSESIIKLKNLITSIEKGNDSSLTKDISEYSSSDVENMRRQMNRLHAKQTRLKKKNMTKEMEVVITSLEKEVGDLQDDLISLLPSKASAQTKAGGVEGQRKSIDNGLKDSVSTLETTQLSRMVSIDALSSFSRKRKNSILHQEPSEAGSIMQAQEDRSNSSGQYLWPPSKTVKTVSVSSESVGSGSVSGSISEGSTSEGGDISSGSAVHSLLHMKKLDSRCSSNGTSSGSLGSGSGSDESDTPKSKSISVTQLKSPLPGRASTFPAAVQPTQVVQGQTYITKPKSIQSILSVCSAQSTHAHWRHTKVPQVSHSSASKTAMSVASLYSMTSIDDIPNSYKSYSPMSNPDSSSANLDYPQFGVRSQDFTVYDSHKNMNLQSKPVKNFPQNVTNPDDQLECNEGNLDTKSSNLIDIKAEVIESQAARFCRLYQSNLMNSSSSRIGMNSSEYFNTPTSFSNTLSKPGYPCNTDTRIYNRKNEFNVNQTSLDKIRESKKIVNNNCNISSTTE